MENTASPDKVFGMLISQSALLNSLIAVLPLQALEALQPQLEKETKTLEDVLMSTGLSDEGIQACQNQAQMNLEFVRDQVQQKQAMQSADGVLQWMTNRLRPTGDQ